MSWTCEIWDPDQDDGPVGTFEVSREVARVILQEFRGRPGWLRLYPKPSSDRAQRWADDHPGDFFEIGCCPQCASSYPKGGWSVCQHHNLRWRSKTDEGKRNPPCPRMLKGYAEIEGIFPSIESLEGYWAYLRIMGNLPVPTGGN